MDMKYHTLPKKQSTEKYAEETANKDHREKSGDLVLGRRTYLH
jgi:hypothetical protein